MQWGEGRGATHRSLEDADLFPEGLVLLPQFGDAVLELVDAGLQTRSNILWPQHLETRSFEPMRIHDGVCNIISNEKNRAKTYLNVKALQC